MTTASAKTLITFRLSNTDAEKLRQIAVRNDEGQSAILRRLIRRGLETRRDHGDEAA